MSDTPLDLAHARMAAAIEDDHARLGFYERLADAEVFLLLEKEPEDDHLAPQVFDTADGRFVLVFDREDRLTDFTGDIAPYAGLSGRSVVTMLTGQDIGLGVNLGVAPSSILIPPEAVAWLAGALEHRPDEIEQRPAEVAPPTGLPENLIAGLDAKLAAAAGLARTAYLVAVTYDDGRRGHMLALIDATPGAEPALARAAGEALIFSGLEAGEMDVAFLARNDPMAARLAKVGLRFDLPEPPQPTAPLQPGMDPTRPPRLR
jgi:SseB protein N-terminal domain